MFLDILYLTLFFVGVIIVDKMKKTKRRKLDIFFFVVSMLFLILFFENFIFKTTLLFISFVIYFIIIYILGSKNYYDIQLKEIEIKTSKVNNDINILFIADLQYDKSKKKFNEKALNILVDKINNESYDMLLLGGDYLNYSVHINTLVQGLDKIKNKENIYAVMGNHDYYFKGELIKKFSSVGIKTLENEIKELTVGGSNITISGVKDLWQDDINYLPIKENINNKDYHILLLHNPDYIENLYKENIDLVLSGHYHHGQVNFIPKVSLAQVVTKYSYGMYDFNNLKLYVTSGVGGTFLRGFFGMYIRWNCRPEIVKVKLKKKENSV